MTDILLKIMKMVLLKTVQVFFFLESQILKREKTQIKNILEICTNMKSSIKEGRIDGAGVLVAYLQSVIEMIC